MAHNHPLLVWDLETSGICIFINNNTGIAPGVHVGSLFALFGYNCLVYVTS